VMESVVEDMRLGFEERDRLKRAAAVEHNGKATTQNEKVTRDHKVRRLCQKATDVTVELQAQYADEDGKLRREVDMLGMGDGMEEFYARLRGIQKRFEGKYHIMAVPMSVEASALGEGGRSAPHFTDEEKSGKYLDLNEIHRQFINLRFAEKISYLEFLETFSRLMDVPQKEKQGMYKSYLEALLAYLTGFHTRAEPLYNLDEDLAKAAASGEAQYASGTFPGWSQEDPAAAIDAAAAEPVDVATFGAVGELEAVGLDVLKASLTALGLKCGGTLEQRAERLFSTKGKDRSEWDKAILAGKPKGGKSKKKRAKPTGAAAALPLVSMEAKVFRLAELLTDTIQLTFEDVQRRQSQTAAERAAEDEDVVVEEGNDAMEEEDEAAYDSDNELIYNPKGLPLDPVTGKPIPYWLYKLHGLNNVYKCEICGDFSYKGPKAFQRHFMEWRHAQGMRKLKIPNNPQFFSNVTRIKDAVALWNKLKSKKGEDQFKAVDEEEYEDSQGNVMNKKTYEDLLKQGLL